MPSPGSGLLSDGFPQPAELRLDEDDGERGDIAFLKDLLSPGPGVSDEFSKEWQDAFGVFDPSAGTGVTGSGQAACLPSSPPSPTGFLPSQLLDHSLSSTGQALASAGDTSFWYHTTSPCDSRRFQTECGFVFQAGQLHLCSRLLPCSLLVRANHLSSLQVQQTIVSSLQPPH